MYQLMIIDDEPIVRTGIKDLIPWEDYQFEVCAEGLDGKDGLKKVMEFMPDLVLVDVKMPGMSGIELIQEARKQGFDGKFIILTGYSDFEFAKQAISLGVRAYLLKPIDEEELMTNVEEVLAELEAKKNRDDYFTKSELIARCEVIRRILLPNNGSEDLIKDMKLYGLEFKYHCFCCAVISMKNNENSLTPSKECINALTRDMCQIDHIVMDDNIVLLCKDYTFTEAANQLELNIKRMEEKHMEIPFVFLGHTVKQWQDIQFSYECARFFWEHRFLYSSQRVITIDMPESVGHITVDRILDQMSNYVDIGDEDGMEQTMSELKEYARISLLKESDIKLLVAHNLILLHNRQLLKYDQKKSDFPSLIKLREQIKNCNSIDSLIYEAILFCKAMSEIVAGSTSDNIAKRVYAYMEKNFDKDLKLENIAKTFNYNSAYLGKLFKKEMGEGFNNILDSIRIENAKKLLIEQDLKVYQVSEKVGFTNIDYFYNKFKKHVGLSPKEFQKKKPMGNEG